MRIVNQIPFAALGMGAAFTVLWGVADPVAAFAEVREVEAEGFYLMGDGLEERMDIAQRMAIANATQAAAEKAGVFVESFSATQMGVITRDEVRAIASTVLEVREPTRVIPEVVANGTAVRYHAYVTALVDTADIEKMLSKSSEDRDAMVRVNKELEAELAKINAEVERLREEYRQADAAEQQRINEEVKRNERRFEAWEWHRKGVKLREKSERERAMKCFQKAIELDPNYADPWRELCIIYCPDYALAHNNPDKYTEYRQKAINAGQRAVELDPKNPSNWIELGHVYDDSDREKAIEYYRKAVEADPKAHNGWWWLGLTYEHLKDYEMAIECYRKAIALESGDMFSTALESMGYCYHKLGNYDKAIEWYRKAIEHHPYFSDPCRDLGEIYFELGNYSEAVKCYRKALEIYPEDGFVKKRLEEAMQKAQ